MSPKLPAKQTLIRKGNSLVKRIDGMESDRPLQPVWPGLPPDEPAPTQDEKEIAELRPHLSAWLKDVERHVNFHGTANERDAFVRNGLVQVGFHGNPAGRRSYPKADCLADLQYLIALLKQVRVLNTPTGVGELAERLAAARNFAGHTQAEAADEIGIDQKAYGEYELGRRSPHKNLEKLTRYIEHHSGSPSKQQSKTRRRARK
jgi:DNA-binding XRE family transcriptional regulator